MILESDVLIIGGGVTGTGVARDLALRGVSSILVEQDDINAGASGGNHGLLHSGARYVSSDPESARECYDENVLLKRLAPHCIEDTGGLFVSVKGDDEKYAADFSGLCRRSGIPFQNVDPAEAKEMEPALSKNIFAATRVPDAVVDPFMLSLENMAHAQKLGATYLKQTALTGFDIQDGRIVRVHLKRKNTGKTILVECDEIVNAAGAWAGEVARHAGVSIGILYSKGTLVVTDRRLTNGVVNRMRPPGDGDIVVPGGTVSILGTTSVSLKSLEDVSPTVAEVDLLVREGTSFMPSLEYARYIRAFAGVRPLLKLDSDEDARNVTRGFGLMDHSANGIKNFITITGGKLTTYRLMAEKAADLVCQHLRIDAPCQTRIEPLPNTPAGQLTEPGAGPRRWLKEKKPEERILCECEMIPQHAIEKVVQRIEGECNKPDLISISVRSRMGKGPCQGTFCGERVLAHLHDSGRLKDRSGISQLKDLLQERWKGERPVLWGSQIIQAHLKEAIYRGFLGL